MQDEQVLRRQAIKDISSDTAAGEWRSWAVRTWRWLRRYPGFTVVVIIPALAATFYYGLIAADIYTSSAAFVVKDANENTSLTGLGSFLQSTGISTVPNDAYLVDAYLQSRDALAELERSAEIRAVYSRPEADFITRFPNLLYHPSFENLFIHYRNWIDVDFDTDSNITTLTVYAFRPADAQAVAASLLKLSEGEVNRLNDRIRNDALGGARKEVDQLQVRAAAIQNEITDFRNKELLLDPNQTSTQTVALLASLESELVGTRAQLEQLGKSASSSPQIQALRARISALENQILTEERKGAGGSDTLAPKMAAYEQLLLKQQFIQQMLQSAVTSLEAAEATVQQQQIYLAPVAVPRLPDRPLYPLRIADTLIVIITSLLIYGIGRVGNAAIREHVLG
jgi:capsular polysaccharide transport system permease protein